MNLADADLHDAYLPRADLRGADLADADLHGADLVGAKRYPGSSDGSWKRCGCTASSHLTGIDLLQRPAAPTDRGCSSRPEPQRASDPVTERLMWRTCG
ncbi:pentapeptide repeat-containing protein [Streptomyces pharetrae]|uniref:pentapeptide repeat-containing protein n=1 Tax=Streptomyces pharetrae TaxID=291370 RepID=UPI003346BDEC